MSVKVLFICAILSVAYAQQTLTYYQSGVKKGYTSWYDSWAPGGGCGYNENIYAGYQPSVVLTAAINQGQYYNGEICGMCIQVNNVTAIGDYNTLKPFPDPPFIAFINNLCTTCTDNQLDFYRTPQVQNNWYLDWIGVDCPVGSTKIHYQIEKGAQNYYFKFLPLYNLRTLAGAWVNQNNAFNACERQNGYFACQAQGGPFGSNPQIKLKSVDGEEITDNIQISLSSTGASSSKSYYIFTTKYRDLNPVVNLITFKIISIGTNRRHIIVQVVSGSQNVNFSPKNVATPGAIKTSNAIRSVTFNALLVFLIFVIY